MHQLIAIRAVCEAVAPFMYHKEIPSDVRRGEDRIQRMNLTKHAYAELIAGDIARYIEKSEVKEAKQYVKEDAVKHMDRKRENLEEWTKTYYAESTFWPKEKLTDPVTRLEKPNPRFHKNQWIFRYFDKTFTLTKDLLSQSLKVENLEPYKGALYYLIKLLIHDKARQKYYRARAVAPAKGDETYTPQTVRDYGNLKANEEMEERSKTIVCAEFVPSEIENVRFDFDKWDRFNTWLQRSDLQEHTKNENDETFLEKHPNHKIINTDEAVRALWEAWHSSPDQWDIKLRQHIAMSPTASKQISETYYYTYPPHTGSAERSLVFPTIEKGKLNVPDKPIFVGYKVGSETIYSNDFHDIEMYRGREMTLVFRGTAGELHNPNPNPLEPGWKYEDLKQWIQENKEAFLSDKKFCGYEPEGHTYKTTNDIKDVLVSVGFQVKLFFTSEAEVDVDLPQHWCDHGMKQGSEWKKGNKVIKFDNYSYVEYDPDSLYDFQPLILRLWLQDAARHPYSEGHERTFLAARRRQWRYYGEKVTFLKQLMQPLSFEHDKSFVVNATSPDLTAAAMKLLAENINDNEVEAESEIKTPQDSFLGFLNSLKERGVYGWGI